MLVTVDRAKGSLWRFHQAGDGGPLAGVEERRVHRLDICELQLVVELLLDQVSIEGPEVGDVLDGLVEAVDMLLTSDLGLLEPLPEAFAQRCVDGHDASLRSMSAQMRAPALTRFRSTSPLGFQDSSSHGQNWVVEISSSPWLTCQRTWSR